MISEGFARPHRNPPFERVKEVVAFAFQHAPLRELPMALCILRFSQSQAHPFNKRQRYWSILVLLGLMPPCGAENLVYSNTTLEVSLVT